MLAFHFPHINVLGAADYLLDAGGPYPALFSRERWRLLECDLRVVSWPKLLAAGLAVVVHLWWRLPGFLTTFGILVAAMWGYGAMAILGVGIIGPARRRSAGQKSLAAGDPLPPVVQ